VFQPAIDAMPAIATGLEAIALQALIMGLKFYMGIKPFVPALEALGAAVVIAGIAFAATFVPAAAAAVVALGGVIATAAIAAAPFLLIGAAVVGVYEAFTHWEEIKTIVGGAFDYIAGLDFAQIGIDIIAGIATGITNGASALLGAIGGAVSGAIDHAKSLLGIASPSKVFAVMGGHTAEGFADGVDDGAPDALAAMGAMVAPPEVAAPALASAAAAVTRAPAASTPASAPASAGNSANLQGATFNFYGVEGADGAVSRFGEMLTRVLEGDAAQLGAVT